MTGIHDHSFGARLGTLAVIVHRNGFGSFGHVFYEVSDGTRYSIRNNGSVERMSTKKCERYGGEVFHRGLPINKCKLRRLNKRAVKK